jgi:Ca2+/Na+ antiporter
MNVRNDVDGLLDRAFVAIAGLTVLLLFWLGYVGKITMAAYIAQWAELHPDIPITTTAGWVIFRALDFATVSFLIIVWLYLFLYMFFIGRTEREARQNKPRQSRPAKPEECPKCKSTHIREAGKEHAGKMYCMSCRRYF